MTLNDMLDAGIYLDGDVHISFYDGDDFHTYYNGRARGAGDLLDCEIYWMYADTIFDGNEYLPVLVIELAEPYEED